MHYRRWRQIAEARRDRIPPRACHGAGPKLEKLSCECYAVVKEETDRLLPYLPPHRAKSIEKVRENLGATLLAA